MSKYADYLYIVHFSIAIIAETNLKGNYRDNKIERLYVSMGFSDCPDSCPVRDRLREKCHPKIVVNRMNVSNSCKASRFCCESIFLYNSLVQKEKFQKAFKILY